MIKVNFEQILKAITVEGKEQNTMEMEEKLRKLKQASKARETELKERGKQLKQLCKAIGEGKDKAEIQQLILKLKED